MRASWAAAGTVPTPPGMRRCLPACGGGRTRTWAIEGCQGIGRHIAARLVAAGEQVVDVPPKLSARTRVFTAGQGRKTDETDAHSVALAATRMTEGCAGSPMTRSWRCCGCWRTGAGRWARTTPG